MEFSEEEKKVFEIEKNGYFDTFYFEENLHYIYTVEENEEKEHDMNVTISFIKRMIAELAKKRGYDIADDEHYDVDAILMKIIEVPTEGKSRFFANFNPLLYKNPEELNNYFSSLTKDLTWEDLQVLEVEFKGVTDGFRLFFADNYEELYELPKKLYYELTTTKGDFAFSEDINEIFGYDAELESSNNNSAPSDGLDKESLTNYIKLINTIVELTKYRRIGYDIIIKLRELSKQKKLEDFYSNEEFSSMFDLIMEHDKTTSSYYFHGTQCLDDAKTIIDEGLGMMHDNLNDTAYREFTKDELLLYERGFGGEVGSDAVVIIDVPKNNGIELNIVTPLQNADSIHFAPSGLQGLNGRPAYIVLPENIVGYVDKMNKQIVFNPKYRNYEQFFASRQSR